MKQYEEGGIEGLARADAKMPDVLPEGIDRSRKTYKQRYLSFVLKMSVLKKTILFRRTKLGNRSMFV